MPILLIGIVIVAMIVFLPKKSAGNPTDIVISQEAEVKEENSAFLTEENPITSNPQDILDKPDNREIFTTNTELMEFILNNNMIPYNKEQIDDTKYKYSFVSTNAEYLIFNNGVNKDVNTMEKIEIV